MVLSIILAPQIVLYRHSPPILRIYRGLDLHADETLSPEELIPDLQRHRDMGNSEENAQRKREMYN
jgi:hypothetical protein